MAVTVLKNISQDEINWYHETRYWMHVSDEKSMISSAEDRGIAKGKNLATLEIIKNALSMNMPLEQITKLTNLSIDDVQEIVKEIK